MIQDVRRSFGASRHCGVTRVVMNSRSLGAGRQWRGEQLMGQMVDGIWHSDEDLAHAKDGHFARPPTRFRGTIERGGAHPPEPDRYHLYVSLACPWAHRALIVRKLKGLDTMIGLSVTHWLMREDGWTFAPGPGVVPDPFGATFLHEVYRRADPRYSGRVTVPILWDKQAGTIVNNESSEIIRIFGSAFDPLGAEEATFTRKRCGARSMPSTRASTRRSTTASTGPASRARKRPTTLRSSPFRHAGLVGSETVAPALSLRQLTDRSRLAPFHDSGPLRRRLLTATSNATSGASSITRPSGTMPAVFINGPESRKP